MLDLDTLRVRPAERSPRWKALGAEEQKRWRTLPPDRLALNARWEMAYSPAIFSYEVPIAEEPWQTRERVHLSVVSPDKAYCAAQPLIPLELGDAVVAASDGTKAVRIHNNVASAFYFGTQPAPSAARSPDLRRC